MIRNCYFSLDDYGRIAPRSGGFRFKSRPKINLAENVRTIHFQWNGLIYFSNEYSPAKDEILTSLTTYRRRNGI